MKRIGYLILFLVLAVSCKSTKTTSEKVARLSAQRIVKNHYNSTDIPKAFKAQLQVKYKGKTELPPVNASLRILKDSVIWLSFSKLGFPVGKLLIYPDKVLFYEKINKRYFSGDYKIISEKIGTEMDFTKVQNLFLGKALPDLRKVRVKSKIDDNRYLLVPKSNNAVFEMFFWIDPFNFNVTREEFIHLKDQKKLQIDYTYSNQKESLNLPQKFTIFADTQKSQTSIEVIYKKVEQAQELTFPFKLPQNYKEIKLK